MSRAITVASVFLFALIASSVLAAPSGKDNVVTTLSESHVSVESPGLPIPPSTPACKRSYVFTNLKDKKVSKVPGGFQVQCWGLVSRHTSYGECIVACPNGRTPRLQEGFESGCGGDTLTWISTEYIKFQSIAGVRCMNSEKSGTKFIDVRVYCDKELPSPSSTPMILASA